MAQIFKPIDNTFFRGIIVGGLLLLIGWITTAIMHQWSSSQTGVGIPLAQPVPFSHEHHVEGLGIDCRFCHTSVEKSSFAGMPSTETCMKCHQEIWKDSPMLLPVRESYRTGKPIVWNRVHNLPDFVYFDHSIHVQKGIACQVCHGKVESMPLMRKENTLYMGWCMSCHEHPGHYVALHQNNQRQPPKTPTEMSYKPWDPNIDPKRVKEIRNCSACHR